MTVPVAALEAVVTDDGLVFTPDTLNKIGARPGDHVVVELRPARRLKSMMGFGARPDPTPFTNEDLRQIRSETGIGIGDDLGR